MTKRMIKIIAVLFCFSLLLIDTKADIDTNTSLKDLRERLAANQKKLNDANNQKHELDNKIDKANEELDKLAKIINDSNEKIIEATEKIEELELEITAKQKEIDTLMAFKQVADKDNVYLEYVFNAKSFTDFIYRASVIDQLSKYNDELIDNMNKLIKENEEQKVLLNKKIQESEESSVLLNKNLDKYSSSMEVVMEKHEDATEALKADKIEVTTYEKLYKQYGCKETMSILECMSVPYATKLFRPLVKGTVTSEFGMRMHPTKHQYLMHQGIDLAVSMNTKVYASAPGIVTKISRVANPNKANSSCGGNKVYIRHIINGKEYVTSYLHLHSISVKLNQVVSLNTVVGYSGGGESYDYCTTGPHLHFAVQYKNAYVNPRNYVSFPAKGKKFTTRW